MTCGIQGTGLGMAITKNIVDMMGGDIQVESEVDMGAEFIVNIPCKIAGESVAREPVPELQGARVLVVDDDKNSCLSVCGLLEDMGLRAEWVNGGAAAIARAKEAVAAGDRYRVFILDWQMPGIDGIEVTRQIRSLDGQGVPIVLLTAYDWADVEDEALAASRLFPPRR